MKVRGKLRSRRNVMTVLVLQITTGIGNQIRRHRRIATQERPLHNVNQRDPRNFEIWSENHFVRYCTDRTGENRLWDSPRTRN
ncbi:hypothetical protein EDB19DRAFT_1729206 [Suillus lakei]|nr:hypothetical protein EDB19DRAFT_1729206 [Suillus lakei]